MCRRVRAGVLLCVAVCCCVYTHVHVCLVVLTGALRVCDEHAGLYYYGAEVVVRNSEYIVDLVTGPFSSFSPVSSCT
jgi:hypothetical protein